MKISVVIPTYRRTYLLGRCLLRLLTQDFPAADYEIIIVTDGPDSDTAGLVAQYTVLPQLPLVSCLSLREKQGPAAARNKGWQQAKGELVVFTDDDCIPARQLLSVYWKNYQAAGTCLAAFTGRIKVPAGPHPTDYERNITLLESADFVTANCACTLKALKAVQGFDETFPAAWREDSDLEFKLMNLAIPIYRRIPAWVIHPARTAAWGISLKEQKKSMYNALLYKKHPEWYRTRISQSPQWKYYSILFCLLLILLGMFSGSLLLAAAGTAGWLFLTVDFIIRRLNGTNRSVAHVSEMVITSALIPFLSIFWTLYGSIKYKVFFL